MKLVGGMVSLDVNIRVGVWANPDEISSVLFGAMKGPSSYIREEMREDQLHPGIVEGE